MSGLAPLALSCLGTAVWEESLFRGLLPAPVARGLGAESHHDLHVCAVCSALFALAHLDLAAGAAGAALRLAQTFCFGMIMARLSMSRGGLVIAMAAHAAYDLICLGLAYAHLGLYDPGCASTSVGALLGSVTTTSSVLASLAVLVPLALLACRYRVSAESPRRSG